MCVDFAACHEVKIPILQGLFQPSSAGDVLLPGAGMFFPHQEAKKSSFAMSVSSHQADTFTGIDLKTCILEKDLICKAFCEVFDFDHEGTRKLLVVLS
jgi:hypothetical protein